MQEEYDRRKMLKDAIKKELPEASLKIVMRPTGPRMKFVESEFSIPI